MINKVDMLKHVGSKIQEYEKNITNQINTLNETKIDHCYFMRW